MLKIISSGKLLISAFFILLIMFAIGCSKSNTDKNNKWVDLEVAIKEDILSEKTETHVNADEQKSPIPLMPQWQPEDRTYDPDNTIYYKTYYDDFVRGYIMCINFPNINLKEEIEDYFTMDEKGNVKIDYLADLFFDSRTIEMDENILKNICYSYGYEVDFQSTSINDLNVRFVEINEIDGLLLYPSRILIQTWDSEHIYLQDITSPISRKIRSVITIDNKEDPIMIVHSTGISVDYISEEELSFWAFRGSYWVLTPLELTVDSSHAHSAGELYADINRDSLYDPVYYRDGIVYRPSMQGDGLHGFIFRLGKMEEIENNINFRLIGISDSLGRTLEKSNCYLEFEIN